MAKFLKVAEFKITNLNLCIQCTYDAEHQITTFKFCQYQVRADSPNLMLIKVTCYYGNIHVYYVHTYMYIHVYVCNLFCIDFVCMFFLAVCLQASSCSVSLLQTKLYEEAEASNRDNLQLIKTVCQSLVSHMYMYNSHLIMEVPCHIFKNLCG